MSSIEFFLLTFSLDLAEASEGGRSSDEHRCGSGGLPLPLAPAPVRLSWLLRLPLPLCPVAFFSSRHRRSVSYSQPSATRTAAVSWPGRLLVRLGDYLWRCGRTCRAPAVGMCRRTVLPAGGLSRKLHGISSDYFILALIQEPPPLPPFLLLSSHWYWRGAIKRAITRQLRGNYGAITGQFPSNFPANLGTHSFQSNSFQCYECCGRSTHTHTQKNGQQS